MRRRPGRRSKVPANLANFDLDRVRRALFRHEGNISKAAKAPGVASIDLRRLCWARHELVALALEQAHRMVDKAEENLRRELYGDHPERSLRAATFVLSHSRAARARGWGRSSAGLHDDIDPRPSLTIVARWADGTLIGNGNGNGNVQRVGRGRAGSLIAGCARWPWRECQRRRR
jgi:hypothetical protein